MKNKMVFLLGSLALLCSCGSENKEKPKEMTANVDKVANEQAVLGNEEKVNAVQEQVFAPAGEQTAAVETTPAVEPAVAPEVASEGEKVVTTPSAEEVGKIILFGNEEAVPAKEAEQIVSSPSEKEAVKEEAASAESILPAESK